MQYLNLHGQDAKFVVRMMERGHMYGFFQANVSFPGRELRPGLRMLLDPSRLGSLQGLFPGWLKMARIRETGSLNFVLQLRRTYCGIR